MKGVIFARVSTEKQDYQRQINELSEYAKKNNIEIVKTIASKISGAKKNAERKDIQELVEICQRESVEIVLVTEMSRLGRNTLEVLQVMEILNDRKICLYMHNYGIKTITNGEISLFTQIICTIMLEMARLERSFITQRLQSGKLNYMKNGGRMGRPKGKTESPEQFLNKHKKVVQMLKRNNTVRDIRAVTGAGAATIIKVKRMINQE